MRTHGTLTRWNDDRGFGFITPANGTGELFVHVSAFPRDGVRPRMNELISFEVETGPDGRQRAVRVMRPGQQTPQRTPPARERRRPQGRKLKGVLVALVFAGLGILGYFEHREQVAPPSSSASDAPLQLSSPPARYSCDGRKMCSQMTSCDEATYFVRNCPDTQMDGDRDGVPCESQWCY